MAGLVSNFAGSGSLTVNDGRFNALNPEAINAVMSSADDGTDPDEEKARETFAILFGSGALRFGRASGSFSVSGGALDVPTISVVAEGTTVLADATINLNTFTLSSSWTIRQTAGAEVDGIQPFVTARFAGPIADPQRQIDLGPLLDLIRSRNLQRQLDQLEALEQERNRVEAERQSAVTPPPAQAPAPAQIPAPAQAPPPPQAAPADAVAPAQALAPESGGQMLGGRPRAEVPVAAPEDRSVQMLREQGPALMNPAMGANAAPTALPFMPVPAQSADPLAKALLSKPSSSGAEAGTSTPAGDGAKPGQSARPAAQKARPRVRRPGRSAAPGRTRRAKPAANAPAQPCTSPAAPKPVYRTLGNGVTVRDR
jgi:hypothetical protein